MESLITISALIEITATLLDMLQKIQRGPLWQRCSEAEMLEKQVIRLREGLQVFHELGAILPTIVDMGQIWEEVARDSDKLEEITYSLEEFLQEMRDNEKHKEKALYETTDLLLSNINHTVQRRLNRSVYRFSTKTQGLERVAVLREDLTFLTSSYQALREDLARAHTSLHSRDMKSFREALERISEKSNQAAELVNSRMLENVYNLLRS